MAILDINRRTIFTKIIYYGPHLAGKTTNIYSIFEFVPDANRQGELELLSSGAQCKGYYELLPLSLGNSGDFSVQVILCAVPGDIMYARTRQELIKDADGIIFVADSQIERLDENRKSIIELEAFLQAQGKTFSQIPLVFQWNKRDMPSALPIAVLERSLNPDGAPGSGAVAVSGEGVFPALHTLTNMIIRNVAF